MTANEIKSHSSRGAWVALLSLVFLLLACGGASSSGSSDLEPGDTRFLIARGSGLEEITLSGQQQRLVELQDKSYVLQPSLSPDGKQVAFIVEIPARAAANGLLDFGADLYVADRNGANVRPLLVHSRTGEYLEAPDWLDSNTLLVGIRGLDMTKRQPFSRILKIDVSTGASEILLEDAVMGSVSRDRKSLVYSAQDPTTRVEQLMVSDVSGKGGSVIVPNSSGLGLFIASAFSPDGSQVAFAAVDVRQVTPPPSPPAAGAHQAPPTHPFAQDVWLVNRDGSGLKRLGETAENMPSISWSGDGSRLYVIGPGYLWRVDPVAGTAEQVRETGDRAWIVWLEGS